MTNATAELTYVELQCRWRLAYNPEGGGLILCIDRGISCEGHTQVVSAHITNTPSLETVLKVVEKRREELNRQIEAFLLFAHHLVKTVAEAAEKRELEGGRPAK